MKTFRHVALLVIACALMVIPGFAGAQGEANKIAGATLMPASELKWVPMAGLEGAQQAPLWGDPTKGAHGILYKWPAGTKVPLHTHTHGDRGVVISGTLTLTLEDGTSKKLPPGSYFSFGANVKHATGCEPQAECTFFVEREGPFDVVMAEGAAGKKH